MVKETWGGTRVHHLTAREIETLIREDTRFVKQFKRLLSRNEWAIGG